MDQHQLDADVIVIGSGAAGLAAANAAAEENATVTLFEKQPSLGGTSNFFHGTFAVESAMQKEQYIAYSKEQAFKNYMEFNHWLVNAALVRALINKSADTIEWLKNYGVVFNAVTINLPDAPRTYHVIKGAGEACIKALTLRAKEQGVKIRLSAPVLKIVKQDGRISGVVVEIDGEGIQVACKAVIIATGGYANNKAWIKKYAGMELDRNIVPIGNTGKMGDGIRMAWEMGAASEGMGVLHMLRGGPFGPEFPFMSVVETAAIQPILWVNPRGERFCDEGIATDDTFTGNVNTRFKDGYSFCLFDDSIKQKFMEEGVYRGMGTAVLPGHTLPDLDIEFQHLLSLNTKELFAANCIEALAEKMEVDPGTLKKTIEQYNQFCDKGRDEEFAKDQKFLDPLTGPTFYAVRARTGFLGTMGGIRVNHKTEAVDAYDNPIPGLYATGLDMGGLHAESYSMKASSGAASAFALNSGRIAGANAANFVG